MQKQIADCRSTVDNVRIPLSRESYFPGSENTYLQRRSDRVLPHISRVSPRLQAEDGPSSPHGPGSKHGGLALGAMRIRARHYHGANRTFAGESSIKAGFVFHVAACDSDAELRALSAELGAAAITSATGAGGVWTARAVLRGTALEVTRDVSEPHCSRWSCLLARSVNGTAVVPSHGLWVNDRQWKLPLPSKRTAGRPAAGRGRDCAASDETLTHWRSILCASLTPLNTSWCGIDSGWDASISMAGLVFRQRRMQRPHVGGTSTREAVRVWSYGTTERLICLKFETAPGAMCSTA